MSTASIASGAEAPTAPPTDPGARNPLERLQTRVAATDRRVRRFRVVKAFLVIQDTYHAAGGAITENVKSR